MSHEHLFQFFVDILGELFSNIYCVIVVVVSGACCINVVASVVAEDIFSICSRQEIFEEIEKMLTYTQGEDTDLLYRLSDIVHF